MEEAVLSMKNKKAPGPDGIPNKVPKFLFKDKPELLIGTQYIQRMLGNGCFSLPQKSCAVLLISKGKGDPETPSAYRPLSLLDTGRGGGGTAFQPHPAKTDCCGRLRKRTIWRKLATTQDV